AGLPHLDDRDQNVTKNNERLVARVVSQKQLFLVVTWRFPDRLAELAYKKGGPNQAHGSREIRKSQHIAINENTRAQQVEKLIHCVAVGSVMVVFFSLHHFGVECL